MKQILTVVSYGLAVATVLMLALGACTDKTIVSVDAGQSKQATIDSLQLVVDSLNYNLCSLSLRYSERTRSVNCLRDFIQGRGLQVPGYCNGRPIDLRECQP